MNYIKWIKETLESVDEYDGTLISAVKQGIKNTARKYNKLNK